MQFYTDGAEHYEFICLDCGHEFDEERLCVRPDECPECGNPDFLTWEEHGDIQPVSPNRGL